jgi:hypothetical protein
MAFKFIERFLASQLVPMDLSCCSSRHNVPRVYYNNIEINQIVLRRSVDQLCKTKWDVWTKNDAIE